ncbi:Cas10/Cmr2 second palm domain-containing protein [Paenibacillus xylanexedens]|uniref:Cas10/Cmr2 second palm domain-containing protein n=1 Tax=Paenibacillus xylanexedens TaxID=528191 RepID=UPI003CFEB16F
MNSYVVAVSMDKLQSFLYDVLQAQIQEKQSNNRTLKTIIESSQFISDQFYQDIGIESNESNESSFAGNIDETLLKCSGMCVFITSLPEDEIVSKLRSLFGTYYRKLSGQLLMKYVYFEVSDLKPNSKQPDHENDEQYQLKAIKESKKRLKGKTCLNSIIAQNQALIFEFHKSPAKDENWSLTSSPANNMNGFTRTINKLYSEQDDNNENHFRVAVIKADLDGMGTVFDQINNYETYTQVSELLSEYICLKHLHNKVKQYKRNDPEFRLFPLYIAGDDIFFAVPTSKLVDGVNLCRDILKQINRGLEQINLKTGAGLQPLSMSIGIDFTFNREPIRYYYERVQKQLDCAKYAPSMETVAGIVPLSCMKISMNEYVLHRYDLPPDSSGNSNQTTSKDSPKNKSMESDASKHNWNHFVSQVKRIQRAMEKGFTAHHFFYGLLSKITDPEVRKSEVKYSNTVLYHVIPQYLNSNSELLRESELLIIESMLKHLIVKTNKWDKPSKEGRLSFNSNQQLQLEKYVRLLLLFSDPRFKIVQNNDSKGLDKKDFDHKRVRGTVFNKTLRYLFDENLRRVEKREEFRNIFVERGTYTPLSNVGSGRGQNSGRKNEVDVYRTLRLSNSLLYRLKGMKDIQQVADMIEATNAQQQEEVKVLEKKREEEHKAPPGLFFDKQTFLRMARSQGMWNSDYIDSLLIFYQLREQSIQFKVHPAYPKKNSGGTKTWKKTPKR